MLKEIQSNAFRTNGANGPIRPKIIFKKGLNVVNGSDTGTNSIGKSTLLMAIDFCFGGDDYTTKLKPVQQNVGDHEINFAFEFNEQVKYFCRSTDEPKIVILCNPDYSKTDEKWSIDEFNKWLNTNYSNNTMLSFRGMISLYMRIYNRENLDELLPIRNHKSQKESDSIETLLKLFDLFGPIKLASEIAKEYSNKKDAFTEAQKYEYIPKITATKYKQNSKRIEELQEEKRQLADKSEKGLLELSSSQAEQISKIKAELATFRRQRGKLFTQIEILKDNFEKNKTPISNDFDELALFFPNIDIARISEIEEFHRDITSIVGKQIKENQQKNYNLINLLTEQIKKLESQLEEISQVKNVSKIVLDQYSAINSEIENLTQENQKYELSKELAEENKEKEAEYESQLMTQASILESQLNSKISVLNSAIFGEKLNTPIFHIKSPKSYEFSTENDDGTGTNYKGMVVMDLATLSLTSLPVLIHDSVVLKHISNESIEKIFELYLDSKKQIFIAIDKETSYTIKTKEIIDTHEIIRLSSGGNELFGYSFSKRRQ